MFMILLIVSVWGFSSAAVPGLDLIPKVPKPGDITGRVSDLVDEVVKPINEPVKVFTDFIPESSSPLNAVFQNKCIEDLGCFYTGPPFWDPLNRPLSLPPTGELKTRYLLYTTSNPKEEQLNVTSESIEQSSFDAKLPLKVLIHGYRAALDRNDIRFDLKDALLKAGDCNVIIVDWTEHNGPYYSQAKYLDPRYSLELLRYSQAVANARVVGAHLAKLLKLIMKTFEFSAENIHIIGHSLGAQMAGWAGERIPNLGRITGLDPAGPYFHSGDKRVRLDRTDAMFVDIIHSDGGENFIEGLGIGDPVGHMDFYPNGGQWQPGCTYLEGFPGSRSSRVIGTVVNFTADLLPNTCGHGRASQYFLESIDNSKCRFLATWCNSYNDFENGDCLPQDSTMSEMGLHAKRIPGVPIKSKFFLRTNDGSSFCNEDSVYLKNDK